MVTPFLSIYLNQNLNISTIYVGFLLAMSTFVQFGGGFIGGITSHKIGYKKSMVISLLVRSFGMLLMVFALFEKNVIILAMFFIALGAAFYMPANKAYNVTYTSQENRSYVISINNAMFSAGMALGPFVAVLFMSTNPSYMFILLGVVFFILAISHQFTLKTSNIQQQLQKEKKYDLKKIIFKAWQPIIFNTLIFYIYFYFQNFMGLYTSLVFNLNLFSWVMFLNFTLMFILQLTVVNIVATSNYFKILIYGFTLMGAGIFILSFPYEISILLGTFIMTLGQALLFLKGDLEIISKISDYPSIAFGIQRLCMGIGGGIGSVLGGIFFTSFNESGKLHMFWVLIAVQCIFIGLISFIFLVKQCNQKG